MRLSPLERARVAEQRRAELCSDHGCFDVLFGLLAPEEASEVVKADVHREGCPYRDEGDDPPLVSFRESEHSPDSVSGILAAGV